MFVKGGPGVDIGETSAVIGMAKGAGNKKVGLITKAIEDEMNIVSSSHLLPSREEP